MQLPISQRDRRTLLAGIVIIGLIVAVGKGIPAWQRWDRAQKDGADHQARELAMATEGMRALPELRDSVAARQRRAATLLSRLVAAPSVPEAAAALATELSTAADGAGIRVFTLSIRPDSAIRDGYARVAVRVNAAGDVAGLTRYLSLIETDSLLLAVRELTVGQPAPAAPDSIAEGLHFDVLVEALARIDTTHKP